MYRLVMTPEAETELRKEIRYSEKQWGKAHAREYSRALRRQVKEIADNPKLFSLRGDILPGIRIKIFKGNQIVYTVHEEDKTVIVLAVLSLYKSPDVDEIGERF